MKLRLILYNTIITCIDIWRDISLASNGYGKAKKSLAIL